MIRTILVDDEAPALVKLKSLLLPYPEYQVCGEFDQAQDAIDQVVALQPHVAFLDISMPGIDGLDLAVALQHRLEYPLQIVFVSAYDRYALTAFEVNATDYLLKPVSRSRFSQTIERLNQIFSAPAFEAASAPPIVGKAETSPEYPMVHTFGKLTLSCNGRDFANWKMAKVRELFAFFLYNRGQSVYRDTILETLWGHMNPERAQSSMNTCNYNLRKLLEESGSGISLSYASNYYELNLNNAVCDTDIFTAACAKCGSITAENAAELATAASLYRGPYFEDVKCEWAELDRKRYANDYVMLRSALAAYHYQSGNTSEAESNAIQALDANPVCTAAWQVFLRILRERQDPTGYRFALKRAVTSYRKILSSDLPRELAEYVID